MTTRTSVAMTADLEKDLCDHLLRSDGQEDICLATYRPSTGATRRTALVRRVIAPGAGDREVHGNASILGDYVLRAAAIAREHAEGLAVCHSHPRGRGWQSVSGPDRDAEASFANLAREITGLPLVGMTLAGGDRCWSARHWDIGTGAAATTTESESVRVLGDRLVMSWNDAAVAPPPAQRSQLRSVTCWGPRAQADLARRSVLVVGLGSIGLDVAIRLAATGVVTLGLMDFDTVEERNLDRLIGVNAADAWLRRSKVRVACRLLAENATAALPRVRSWEHSICEPEGLRVALDFDLVISCVDRPWPRAVLNAMAYRDLIPVIDGGIAIDTFPSGDGMRNATWRSHVIRPGRACMSCNGQLDLGAVAADVEGVLDDPGYVSGLDGRVSPDSGQNVAALSVSAAAALLAQYVSLNVGAGGMGEPGPLQYVLSAHSLEHLKSVARPNCRVESLTTDGDRAPDLTGRHALAEARRRTRMHPPISVRAGRVMDDVAWWARLHLSGLGLRYLSRRADAVSP